jgi:asparagine synthase (glutamine-hydrolysing)
MNMPIFEKRRFQHGAVEVTRLREKLPAAESVYRKSFLGIYGA